MRANSPKKHCPALWFPKHNYRAVMHLSVRRMFIFDPAQERIKRPRGLGQIRVRRFTIFFSAQNLVKSKKSHNVRRCPIFRTNSSVEKEKKVNTSAGRSFSRNFPKFSCEHDLTYAFIVPNAETRRAPKSAGYGATAQFAHCLIWP